MRIRYVGIVNIRKYSVGTGVRDCLHKYSGTSIKLGSKSPTKEIKKALCGTCLFPERKRKDDK